MAFKVSEIKNILIDRVENNNNFKKNNNFLKIIQSNSGNKQ